MTPAEVEHLADLVWRLLLRELRQDRLRVRPLDSSRRS